MKGKQLKLTLAILTAVSLLSACGSGGSSGSAKTSGTGNIAGPLTAPGESPSDKLDLVIYSEGSTSPGKFADTYGKDLKEKFPNWSITYTFRTNNDSLNTLLTTQQQVDIIFDSIGYIPNGLIKGNLQYDMTDLAKKYKVDLSKFEPTMINGIKGFSSKGELFGLPIFNGAMVLFYNKDIFDKFGVAYPKDGMTWEQANDLGKSLTRKESGVQYLGIATSQGHIMKTNPYSIPSVDPATHKTTINSSKYTEQWKKFYETVYLGPTKAPGYVDWIKANKNKVPFTNEFFKSKMTAMFGYFAGSYPNDPQNPMNWDMVSFPTMSDQKGIGPQYYPNYMAITNISKHKDAAMQVIEYLTSAEYQMKLSKSAVLPVLKDDAIQKAFASESDVKDKHWSAVFYNKPAPMSPKNIDDPTAESAYRKHITDYIYGTMDLNTLFRTAQEDGDKALEQAAAK